MATTECTTASCPEVTSLQIAPLKDAGHADAVTASIEEAALSPPENAARMAFMPRQLKVSYLPQSKGSSPFIRLGGKWLAHAGFHIGADVRITVAPQRLTIELKPPESKSKSQIREERRAALKSRAEGSAPAMGSVYPSLGNVEMVHTVVCDSSPIRESCQDSTAAGPGFSTTNVSQCAKRERRPLPGRGTWPQRVGAILKPALGDLLSEERSQQSLHPAVLASHAEVNEATYRAIDRGERQPDLSTFIAIAWTLNQDPRELFEKLLLQMGFPSGTWPVLLSRTR